jgi:hypothetical protein
MRAAIAALAPRQSRAADQAAAAAAAAKTRAPAISDDAAGSPSSRAGPAKLDQAAADLARYKTFLQQSQEEIERLQQQVLDSVATSSKAAAAHQAQLREAAAEAGQLRSQLAAATTAGTTADAKLKAAADEIAGLKTSAATAARDQARQVCTLLTARAAVAAARAAPCIDARAPRPISTRQLTRHPAPPLPQVAGLRADLATARQEAEAARVAQGAADVEAKRARAGGGLRGAPMRVPSQPATYPPGEQLPSKQACQLASTHDAPGQA